MGQSMLGSRLGSKADNFFEVAKQHLDCINPGRIESSLSEIQTAAAALKDYLDTQKVNLTLDRLQDMAQQVSETLHWTRVSGIGGIVSYSLLVISLSSILMLLLALIAVVLGSKFTSHVIKHVQKLSDNAEIQLNLVYQDQFARMVYNLVKLHVDKHKVDPETNKSSLAQYGFSDQYRNAPSHYLLIYHPGSNWHATFQHIVRLKKSLPALRIFSKRECLMQDLPNIRKELGPKVVIHILLPSVHRYEITGNLDFSAEMLPVRIWGLTDDTGLPYCRASITGLQKPDIVDVGSSSKDKSADVSRSVMVLFGYLLVIMMGTTLGFGMASTATAALIGYVLLNYLTDMFLLYSWVEGLLG